MLLRGPHALFSYVPLFSLSSRGGWSSSTVPFCHDFILPQTPVLPSGQVTNNSEMVKPKQPFALLSGLFRTFCHSDGKSMNKALGGTKGAVAGTFVHFTPEA